ncbi:gliding motility lipoprotein GldH [Belliella baltica]|nr:gliding motility lipoprotein GldH [Belliella baltica]
MPKKIFHSAFILLSLWMISCDGNRVFESYSGFETQQWNIIDTVTFEIPEIKSHSHTLISIKFNTDYGYRNLYVKYILSDSLGNQIESQLVNIPLFDSQGGKPLGDGFGSTFTKIDTLPILSKEAYSRVQFVQYMRVEELDGLEALGIKQVKE